MFAAYALNVYINKNIKNMNIQICVTFVNSASYRSFRDSTIVHLFFGLVTKHPTMRQFLNEIIPYMIAVLHNCLDTETSYVK